VDRIVAAVVQMNSTSNVERNLASAKSLVRDAAARHADFVALPENFALMRSEGEAVPEAQNLTGPWVSSMCALARDLEVTLLLGSIPERIGTADRVHNTSVLIGPGGEILATYRKIHLFDVDLPEMQHLKESRHVEPGDTVVVAQTSFGGLGLSICYDLRFPELYRQMTRKGASILAVPSAFTDHTGRDHWEVLLRARAIENLAFVVAPAQEGFHGGVRTSFGHSMIVDPWGTILAEIAAGEGVALAPLDFARQDRLRHELPVLSHARLL